MNRELSKNKSPQQKPKPKPYVTKFYPKHLRFKQQKNEKKPDLATLIGSQKFYRKVVLEYLRILQNCLIRDGKKQRATR